LLRFRQGNFITHPEDYEDEPGVLQMREYY
jgi:hypothetical protein